MAIDCGLSSRLGPPACEKDAKALQFIEEMTQNPDSVQEMVLSEILSRNADTEYLMRFQLNGATDRDTFKSKVPVVTYEDLLLDIQRISNGDRSPIFSSHPISEFLTSSGTSAGERKLMPTISEEMDRRQLLYSLLMPVMNLYMPGLDKGKGLYLLFIKAETKTPGGLVARPVLTSYYKSQQFKSRPFDPYNVYTSPNEAILCPDSFQSMYAQMICGLIMRHEVLRVGAVFASGLLRAIRFLQLNWQQLAHDISTGTLNPKITDPSIKECMANILKPGPELADFIIKECSGENWESIITRIWPNTKYLDVIVTGAMAQYIPTLDYYSGGLPKACTMYASSECYFGLNLYPICKPSEVSYTIMPNMGYFEFLPHDDSSPSTLSRDSPPRLVDLADLEVGKYYELVITTYAGLCRYRVGDILQVTGFHNKAPQFRFVRRKNVLLSIDSDKTDEAELQNAVENASVLLKEFNTSVVEYTSFADTKRIPGHYVIYWELLMKDPSNQLTNEVLNQCCLAMEESLNSVYRQGRVADHSIGPLEIRVVKNGTFEELMDYAISRGASINQYKVPRVLSNGIVPLWAGVIITACDCFIFLFLENYGVRKLEAFFAVLIGVMALSFAWMFGETKPSGKDLLLGILVPKLGSRTIQQAVGVVGCIIMPHNVFLHSALVQSRQVDQSKRGRVQEALNYYSIESTAALIVSFIINVFVTTVFAKGFYGTDLANSVGLVNAGQYLEEKYGGGLLPILYIWGMGLLAAGQSSTITGTYAGQFIMGGFLNLRLKKWMRSLITRSCAIIPTVTVAVVFETSEDSLDVLNEWLNVLQSIQIPFALIPLLCLVSKEQIMGTFRIGPVLKIIAWLVAALVTVINGYLMLEFFNSEVNGVVFGAVVCAFMAAYVAFIIYLVSRDITFSLGQGSTQSKTITNSQN